MGISEVIVIIAAVAILGVLWWFFFGPKNARQAELVGGVQEVDITVKGGYSPDVIRVTEGVPLRLRFDRQESGDCTSRVVFADFRASKTLPAFGTATLEFTPDKVGEFKFACGMNMIHGTLIVEPSDGSASTTDGGTREVAAAVGVGPSTEAELATERVEFRVSGMSCASCVVNIESVLGGLPGWTGWMSASGPNGPRSSSTPPGSHPPNSKRRWQMPATAWCPGRHRDRPTPRTPRPPNGRPRSPT